MLFVVLCPGTPEGSTGSGSGYKASQRTGQRLKVSGLLLDVGAVRFQPWIIYRVVIKINGFDKCRHNYP